MMRLAFEMASIDLRRLVRDRRAFLALFIMPLLFTSVLSFALGNLFGGKALPVTHVTVVNQDAGPFGGQLVRFLTQQPGLFKVTTSATVATARSDITADQTDVVVVVPRAYSAHVGANLATNLEVDASISKSTAQSIVQNYLDAYGAQLGESRTLQHVHGQSAQSQQLRFDQNLSGMNPVTAGSYYAIGMMVMFLLTNAINRGGLMVREKQTDRYKRMLAAPTSRLTLAFGHLMSSFLILALQGTVILAGSRYILGVQLGPVNQTALLLLGYAASLAGISVVLGSWIRSPQFIDSIGNIGANIAAVLGGSIFPIYGFPAFMQWVTRALPNGRAVTGLVDTVMGIPTQALLVPVTYLLVLGLALGLIGGLRYGRTA